MLNRKTETSNLYFTRTNGSQAAGWVSNSETRMPSASPEEKIYFKQQEEIEHLGSTLAGVEKRCEKLEAQLEVLSNQKAQDQILVESISGMADRQFWLMVLFALFFIIVALAGASRVVNLDCLPMVVQTILGFVGMGGLAFVVRKIYSLAKLGKRVSELEERLYR